MNKRGVFLLIVWIFAVGIFISIFAFIEENKLQQQQTYIFAESSTELLKLYALGNAIEQEIIANKANAEIQATKIMYENGGFSPTICTERIKPQTLAYAQEQFVNWDSCTAQFNPQEQWRNSIASLIGKTLMQYRATYILPQTLQKVPHLQEETNNKIEKKVHTIGMQLQTQSVEENTLFIPSLVLESPLKEKKIQVAYTFQPLVLNAPSFEDITRVYNQAQQCKKSTPESCVQHMQKYNIETFHEGSKIYMRKDMLHIVFDLNKNNLIKLPEIKTT